MTQMRYQTEPRKPGNRKREAKKAKLDVRTHTKLTHEKEKTLQTNALRKQYWKHDPLDWISRSSSVRELG